MAHLRKENLIAFSFKAIVSLQIKVWVFNHFIIAVYMYNKNVASL